jgi:hypothetical protein
LGHERAIPNRTTTERERLVKAKLERKPKQQYRYRYQPGSAQPKPSAKYFQLIKLDRYERGAAAER